MVGSLFLVSVQKTPGAKVTSDSTGDRNLTYYSGVESSWVPTGERYGKDTFVHQSACSD